MKHLIIAIVVLASFAASAQIGVDAIAKQRAKDVANQNNNRSVDLPAASPTPAATQPAAPAAVTATPLNSSQQAYARFQSEVYAVNTNSTADVKQALARDLLTVAQGANKPSAETVSKLADHLTVALGEAKLPQTKKTRVAQDVAVLMNSANGIITPVQKQAMIKDVQSILESGGASSDDAAAVAGVLQTAADELVKPAAK